MFKKIIKFSAILGIILALLLGVAIWRINPILEKLRPQIVKKVSDTLGREVSIGEMQARFFPQTGIELSDVGLNSEGNSDNARIGKVILYTNAASLFRGQIDVSELRLEDGKFEIVRQANGSITLAGIELLAQKKSKNTPTTNKSEQVNKADQKGASEQSKLIEPAEQKPLPPESGTAAADQTASATQSAKADDPKKAAALDFKIEDASIDNIEIVWHDKMVSPPARVSLKDITVELENIAANADGTIDLSASLLGLASNNLTIKGNFRLPDGGGLPKADITTRLTQLDLKRVKEIATSYGAGDDKLSLDKSLDYELNIKTSDDGIELSSNIDAGKALISFDKAFTKASGTPLSIDVAAVPSLLGAVDAKTLGLTIAGIKLNAPTSYDPKNGVSSHISTVSFELSELASLLPSLGDYGLKGSIESDVKIKVAAKPKEGSLPDIRGTIAIKNVSAEVPLPQENGQLLKLPISDGSGTITLNGDSLQIKPLQVKVAGQNISLGANVTNLKKPDASYAISAKNIALKPILTSLMPGGLPSLNGTTLELLQLTGSHGTSSRTGSSAVVISNGTIAGAALKKVDLKARYAIAESGSIKSLDVKDGVIEAFGGRFTLSPNISDTHALKASLLGRDIDLAQLGKIALADSRIGVAGNLEKFTGKVKTDLRDPVNSLVAVVNGKAIDGEITGFNVLRSVLEKLDAIPGMKGSLLNRIPEKYRIVVQGDSTKFESLNFETSTRDKLITLKAFTLDHPAYIISGEGTVAFAGAMTLKTQLRLTPLLTEELVLKEPKVKLLMDKGGNIVIPVIIKMSGGKPLVLPDVEQLLGRAATNTAKEAGKRALDKVAPGLGGALDSLF
jgi:hypothetical protein